MTDAARDDGLPGSTRVAVLLAAVAGFVDGVGVHYVVGVFVSFMSGNTTTTGIALGTADWTQLLHVGIAIPTYLGGVVVGSLVLLRSRPADRCVVLGASAALLAVFVTWGALTDPHPGQLSGARDLVAVLLLVLPMGLLTTVLRHVGTSAVGLGYVTGTLVSLGHSVAAALVSRRRADWAPVRLYLGLWSAFFLGAAAGAVAVAHLDVWAVGVPVAALLVVVGQPRNWRPGVLEL